LVAPELTIGLPSFAAEDPGDWGYLLERAVVADEAGVDRVVASDHVVYGEHLEEYARPEIGGSLGGRQQTGPDGHWLEPLTVLSVVAGLTSRVRLRTNILLAALRRPVVLAKTAATLDVLSGGRLDLGVGVGWQREEYEAAGLDFSGRGRLLDHTLDVCQTLWRQPRASYDSPELHFEAIHQMPKPRQPGGVPIWVSGTVNPHVVSRLARFGAGWIPWGPAAQDIRTGLPQMQEALAKAGRDPAGLQVVGYLNLVSKGGEGTGLTIMGTPRPASVDELDLSGTMATVPELGEIGVTDFMATVTLPDDRGAAAHDLRRLMEAFRAATGQPPPS
jgi:probable F420-dependent oxidoreductase